MKYKKAIVGTTHHAWQFGREITNRLNYLASNPNAARLNPDSLLDRYFADKLKTSTFSIGEFDLVLFKSLKKASKNNHCWIVISDYWADFMERIIDEFGYKAGSRWFLKHICKYGPTQFAEWSQNFHLHFQYKSRIGKSKLDWKEFIINQHQSDVSFIMKSQVSLMKLDEGRYPQIGFVDLDCMLYYRDMMLLPCR